MATQNELEQMVKSLAQSVEVLAESFKTLQAKPVKASGKGKTSSKGKPGKGKVTKTSFFSAQAHTELAKPSKAGEFFGSFGNPDTGYGLVGSLLNKPTFKGKPTEAVAEAKRLAPTAWGELIAHCNSKLALDDIASGAMRGDVAYYRGAAANAVKSVKRKAALDASAVKAVDTALKA